MRILVFGDSITQGFWDLEYGGWVQRLRREYDSRAIKNLSGSWPAILNLGLDGNTTADVVKRMSGEIEVRRWRDDPFILIFAVGLNDTTFAGEEVMATSEQYADELDVLISGARHFSDDILLVGLTPVDEELCNPWIHSSTGKSFTNERILEFEGTLRKVCIEQKITNIEIFEKFQEARQDQELLADGLHPNDLGHQLIADLVRPVLDKLL